jgi:hypothetical protein
MEPEISEILEKALSLPAEARAALAGSLLESLDELVDETAELEYRRLHDGLRNSTRAK